MVKFLRDPAEYMRSQRTSDEPQPAPHNGGMAAALANAERESEAAGIKSPESLDRAKAWMRENKLHALLEHAPLLFPLARLLDRLAELEAKGGRQ